MFFAISFRDWLQNHSPALEWFLLIASVIPALLTQHEIREKIKESKGWKKCGRVLELAFLLLLPILVFISTKASEWSAESALKDTKSEVVAESNRLTQIESKYDEATNDLAVAKQAVHDAVGASQKSVAIADKLAPWKLTPAQVITFSNALIGTPKLKVQIIYIAGNQDSWTFASQISDILKQVGYEQPWDIGAGVDMSGVPPSGVAIWIFNKENPPPFGYLQRAFKSVGLDAAGHCDTNLNIAAALNSVLIKVYSKPQ